MDCLFEEKEIERIAKELVDKFSSQKIWLFHGEMGSGKTTIIKAICQCLGVIDEMSSPTFSIVNEYVTKNGTELYHFDFYRMKDPSEGINIGIEDYFFSGKYCFIEWPNVIEEFLPEKYLEISIKLVGNKTRNLIATLHEPTF
jgi:tRNA threonylcarbamoyladenosine biosynthesis protein TsaE